MNMRIVEGRNEIGSKDEKTQQHRKAGPEIGYEVPALVG